MFQMFIVLLKCGHVQYLRILYQILIGQRYVSTYPFGNKLTNSIQDGPPRCGNIVQIITEVISSTKHLVKLNTVQEDDGGS